MDTNEQMKQAMEQAMREASEKMGEIVTISSRLWISEGPDGLRLSLEMDGVPEMLAEFYGNTIKAAIDWATMMAGGESRHETKED